LGAIVILLNTRQPAKNEHVHRLSSVLHQVRGSPGAGGYLRCIRRIEIFLAALATALTAAAAAQAADMRATKAAPAQTCAMNWYQGWYVGLNFGGADYKAFRTDQNAQLINVATYTQKQTGIFGGGGQVGYNWTTCYGLFGIEADGMDGSIVASTGLLPSSANADVSITSRLNGLVIMRGRGGLVLDKVLLYLTGGVAAVHTLTTYLNIAGDQFTFSDWRWGWATGAGAELSITSNVSLRSEVLYIGVADRTYTFVSPTLGPGSFTHGDSLWVGRVGLNVKLGFDPAIPTY
jgi:opacity protein-like surface antigen